MKVSLILSSAVCAFSLSLLLACGGAGGGTPVAATPAPRLDAAAINKAKCGGCHPPFDPGTMTRAQVEAAFKPHKAENRVTLTDDEWGALVDYLATKK
jgi:hypothetical protein